MIKRVFTLCVLALLIGCVPPKQIEKLGIVTTYGVDFNDDGSLDNTLLYTQFDPAIQEPIQTANSKSQTYEGAISNANLKTHYKLVTGQIRLKVFGKEVAETGVMRLLSNHYRDAAEPANIYIVVSDTTAKEVLNSKKPMDLSKFLYNLIDNNRKREILPKSDFFDFTHKYNDIGIDPILPLITTEEQSPVIDSIGLFQNDMYVDSMETEHTFLFKLITAKFKAGKREVALPKQKIEEFIKPKKDQHKNENLNITLSEIKSKGNITLKDAESLKYNVDIKLDSRLLEMSEPLTIKDETVLNKLEGLIEEKFTTQLEELLDKFKELNVDPIGFGTIYDKETKHNDLTEEEWRKKYPTIDVDFKVDVNITRHGIFE